jgi:hypothetical protein
VSPRLLLDRPDRAHGHDHGHDHPHGHGHDHQHDHAAAHAAAPETVAGPSGPATVAVEIGPGYGALVVTTPEGLDGQELEIRAVGQEWNGTHTAVRRRDAPDRVRWAAIFPSLRSGSYELRVKGSGSGSMLTVEVPDAGVAQADWSGAPA